MDSLAAKAAKNVGDILRLAIRHTPERKAVVIFDERTPLAKIIASAYRAAMPEAQFLDFDALGPDAFFDALKTLTPGDLVVLVQSSTFRLNEFRIRIELFKLGLATIDHMHLERATELAQFETYVDALAYDPSYYLTLGRSLKERIDRVGTTVVHCAGTKLTYEGGMEEAKLNVGDYSEMKNVGGTFPIGEVFSEPKDIAKVNGEAMLFAFAGLDHYVQLHAPFKIVVEHGVIVRHEGPPEFGAVLDQIRSEEKVLVREFGLGLNSAMGKSRLLNDITAFERQKGLHFSLGEKHGVYKKPGFNPKKTHFHIDVFVDVERIEMDGETIFVNGDFL